jgi:hypothetical protein
MHRSLHPPTHRRVRPARAFPPYATASPIMQRNLHPPSHRHAPPAFQLVPPALSRVPHNAQEPPSSIAPTHTAGYPARAARPPPRPSYCTGATILHRTDCTPRLSIMLRNLHTPPHYHSPRNRRPFYYFFYFYFNYKLSTPVLGPKFKPPLQLYLYQPATQCSCEDAPGWLVGV